MNSDAVDKSIKDSWGGGCARVSNSFCLEAPTRSFLDPRNVRNVHMIK